MPGGKTRAQLEKHAMMERTGQVRAVTDRDFQSVKLWSFQLEGSDRFYRTQKVRPDVEVGDWITFREKNGIVMTDSITKGSAIAQSEQVEDPASVGGTAMKDTSAGETVVGTSATAPVTSAPTDVGKRIRFQTARADATRLVVAALEHDQLPHPTNVAKGKRLDLLLGYIDEVTKALLAQEEAA